MLESMTERLQSLRDHWQRLPGQWHADHPLRYRIAAAGLALAGYAWLVAFPLLALVGGLRLGTAGLAPTSAWGYLDHGLLALGLAGTLILARARFGLPDGEPLGADTAPKLYALVESVRQELQGAAVDEIRITGEFDVQLLRTPVSGFPFVMTHTLMIGMPVLQCLSEAQLKAWVASQLGELSRQRMQLGSWIAQLRQLWVRYRNHFCAGSGPARLLIGLFFDRYTRLFHRFTAPLMQSQQYVRDRHALRTLGYEDTAEWMVMQAVMGRFLEQDYWPSVHHIADKAPEPTINPYRNLGMLLPRRLETNEARRWLREAWSHSGSAAAPGLKQRLQAIAAGEAQYPGLPEPCAADSLMEHTLTPLLDRVDSAWQQRERHTWQLRHQKSCAERERLEALRAEARAGTLQGRKAMEYAALMKRYGTTEEAHAAYEQILATNPDDAQIVFGTGRYLTGLGDEHGIRLLEQAMEMDKRYVVPACRLISEFRNRRGNITRFPAHEGQTIRRRVS
ncbi:M48 family metalloprotease [Thiohalobacter thiocyanaticus]|nr:hypothetical protein [Thiohalobacter thiocyanaticus]